MSKIFAYFKTESGRTSLKWGAAFLILLFVCIYLFRRVKDSGSDNPLVKQLEAVNDSLRVRNALISADNARYKSENDSLLIQIASKETIIQQKTVYVDREVIKWRDASAKEIESFLNDRYKTSNDQNNINYVTPGGVPVGVRLPNGY